MKKKLRIIIPILLVLIIGGFAAVYFAMTSDTTRDPQSPTINKEASGERLNTTETPDTETPDTETPDTEQTEPQDTAETEQAPTELTESELHEIFEDVYLKSVYNMRKNLDTPMDSLIEAEYSQIKDACPEGKILPDNYRELYDIWRENYRIEDLSYVFKDKSDTYYATSDVTSYTNIYDNIVVDSFAAKEAVIVTGIGYYKASGWLRIRTESGVFYVEASGLTNKIEEQFEPVSKTMYASTYNGFEVSVYIKPNAALGYHAGDYEDGESVTVIGIGFGEASGWVKIEKNGLTRYVKDYFLTDGTDNNTDNNSNNTSGNDKSSGNSDESTDKSNGDGYLPDDSPRDGNGIDDGWSDISVGSIPDIDYSGLTIGGNGN